MCVVYLYKEMMCQGQPDYPQCLDCCGLRLCQSPYPELPVKQSLLVREMQDSNNY